MEKKIIKADKRVLDTKNSVKSIRKKGLVPGILYGKRIGSVPLKISEKDLTNLGVASFLEISLPNASYPAVVREIQKHPLSGKVSHVDFQQVELNETIKAEIPVVFRGEPVGTAKGGILQYGERVLEVEALVSDLPEHLELDLTPLDVGEKLTAADIKVDPKIKIVSDPATILAVMTAPRAAEELPPAREKVETAAAETEAPAEEG